MSRQRAFVWLLTCVVLALGAGPWQPVSGQEDPFLKERQDMVQRQIRKRGIETPGVLRVMEVVPRHLFVQQGDQSKAYEDVPVTIAPGKTLSQAYVSARMVSLLELSGDEKVLEIGTGSGYDAALLSRMADQVFTIEIDKKLGERAKETLQALGYKNVHVKVGDGYHGWPEEAPFDAILVTAAPERLPEPLIEQLRVGGRMVIAVGGLIQNLQLVIKTEDEPIIQSIDLVNLSPMTGDVQHDN